MFRAEITSYFSDDIPQITQHKVMTSAQRYFSGQINLKGVNFQSHYYRDIFHLPPGGTMSFSKGIPQKKMGTHQAYIYKGQCIVSGLPTAGVGSRVCVCVAHLCKT